MNKEDKCNLNHILEILNKRNQDNIEDMVPEILSLQNVIKQFDIREDTCSILADENIELQQKLTSAIKLLKDMWYIITDLDELKIINISNYGNYKQKIEELKQWQ
jgi:hypothetical protein